MEKLIEEIKVLAAEELTRANNKFPPFRSPHEGYAVILEEVEEAAYEMTMVRELLGMAWAKIKSDQEHQNTVLTIGFHAEHLAAEAIQISAMCQKFKALYGGTE